MNMVETIRILGLRTIYRFQYFNENFIPVQELSYSCIYNKKRLIITCIFYDNDCISYNEKQFIGPFGSYNYIFTVTPEQSYYSINVKDNLKNTFSNYKTYLIAIQILTRTESCKNSPLLFICIDNKKKHIEQHINENISILKQDTKIADILYNVLETNVLVISSDCYYEHYDIYVYFRDYISHYYNKPQICKIIVEESHRDYPIFIFTGLPKIGKTYFAQKHFPKKIILETDSLINPGRIRKFITRDTGIIIFGNKYDNNEMLNLLELDFFTLCSFQLF
jgi:hypothetical protein